VDLQQVRIRNELYQCSGTNLHDLWHVLHDIVLHADGSILRIRVRKCRQSSIDLQYYHVHTISIL